MCSEFYMAKHLWRVLAYEAPPCAPAHEEPCAKRGGLPDMPFLQVRTPCLCSLTHVLDLYRP